MASATDGQLAEVTLRMNGSAIGWVALDDITVMTARKFNHMRPSIDLWLNYRYAGNPKAIELPVGNTRFRGTGARLQIDENEHIICVALAFRTTKKAVPSHAR
jgi:hypothetical protein